MCTTAPRSFARSHSGQYRLSCSAIWFTLAYTITPAKPIDMTRSNSFTDASGSLSGSVASEVNCFDRSALIFARESFTRLAKYADCFGSSIVEPGAVSVMTCMSMPASAMTCSR